MTRRTWAEIDIRQIKNNYTLYKAQLYENQEIMAVVKADAYGHGDVQVARALQELGAKRFAVSNIDEAIKLREGGVDGEILIFGYTPPDSVDSLIKYDITQAIYSEEYARAISSQDKRIKAHIAVDTGMNRIGFSTEGDSLRTIEECRRKLCVTGVFTHLCSADSDDGASVRFTKGQIERFGAFLKTSAQDLGTVHYLNSAGGLRYNDGASALVRLGINLYGLRHNYGIPLPEGIKPALTWKSVVSMVKDVGAGDYIGYGLSYKAPRNMRVATVPVGYADGYSRMLSNRGKVQIRGKSASVVGRVCMDQFMVDVTDVPGAAFLDEVTLLGDFYTADDMASDLGTIGYEVVCGISKRVPRVYK